MTNADFERMIPDHFIRGGQKPKVQVDTMDPTAVVVTVQKAVPDVPMLPPAPTELGRVTETITKSTLTETVMTRVTDNRLVEPLISEVNKQLILKLTLPDVLFFSCTKISTRVECNTITKRVWLNFLLLALSVE